MKINEVEAITGIPKKNIRYYEAEGLLQPQRDSANGYRHYTPKDVELLEKIRLLRKLDMPVEEIRRIIHREQTMLEALERQKITLKHRHADLESRKTLCDIMIQTLVQGELNTEIVNREMIQMETTGVRFHDYTKTDHKKKIRTVWYAAIGFALVMLALAFLIHWANGEDPLPTWAFLLLEAFVVVPAIGVFIAGYTRIKEIKGGEEDDLSNY